MNEKIRNIIKHIEYLSPVEDAEKNEIYLELLKKSVKEKTVRNIALAGPYGSGKSSILRTFTKTESKSKVVEISLANFENIGSDDKEQENNQKESIQAKVEKSVLQQLFF